LVELIDLRAEGSERCRRAVGRRAVSLTCHLGCLSEGHGRGKFPATLWSQKGAVNESNGTIFRETGVCTQLLNLPEVEIIERDVVERFRLPEWQHSGLTAAARRPARRRSQPQCLN